MREEEGLAARFLESLDITIEHVRAQVARLVSASDGVTEGQMPFTPGAKEVLELALREAQNLGHKYIGTEHILLGIFGENDGVAARTLLGLDADLDTIRSELIRMLSGPRQRADVPPEGSPEQRQRIAPGWLDGLGPMLNQLADEIRRELGREPDAGDLLLVLSAMPETLPAQALAQLGVDVDELCGQLERLRSEARSAHETLAREIDQARIEKERALESQQFDAAARYRDRERELKEQRRQQTTVISPRALQAVRRRIGLSAPPSTDG